MSHDELLAALYVLPANVTELEHGAKAVKALRAVVELHKPWNFGCSHCINIEGGYMSYPCPTIKAIEKELS